MLPVPSDFGARVVLNRLRFGLAQLHSTSCRWGGLQSQHLVGTREIPPLQLEEIEYAARQLPSQLEEIELGIRQLRDNYPHKWNRLYLESGSCEILPSQVEEIVFRIRQLRDNKKGSVRAACFSICQRRHFSPLYHSPAFQIY